jgi:DNA-binding response OmpR family regulator
MYDNADVLNGCRVFVVEDNAMASVLLMQLLESMSCEIAGSASRFADAEHKSRTLAFDVALLDINLRGERIFPIAEALQRNGTPFVMVTGYDASALPESLRGTTVLQKPYRKQELEIALRNAVHRC